MWSKTYISLFLRPILVSLIIIIINNCFPIALCFIFLFNTSIIIFPQKNVKGADERTIQELEDNIISVSEYNGYFSKYLIDE